MAQRFVEQYTPYVDVREDEQAVYYDVTPASEEDLVLRYDERQKDLYLCYQDGASLDVWDSLSLSSYDWFQEPAQAVVNNGVLSIYFSEE
jgi:hypothetical protein